MRLVWRAYVVAIHLALLAGVAYKLGLFRPPPPTRPAAVFYDLQRQMDPVVPDGATIFLGDSIVYGMPVAAVTPLAANFGIPGQRSDHLIEAMGSYHSLHRARMVVVMIGTNDVLQGMTNGLEDRYRAILSMVPPKIPVILVSIPPLAVASAQDAAKAAETTCKSDPRCYFVDSFSALSVNGDPRREFLSDGIHLTAGGYRVLIELLRQRLVT